MVNQPGFYVQVAIWSQVVSAVLFFAVLVWLWLKFHPAGGAGRAG